MTTLSLLWRDWSQSMLRECTALRQIELVYLFLDRCQERIIAECAKEFDNESLLSQAAAGRWEGVNRLLQDPSTDVNQKDEHGYNALQLATIKGQDAVVKLLQAHAPTLKIDQRPKPDGVYTIGGRIIRRGLYDAVGKQVLSCDLRKLYRTLCAEIRKQTKRKAEEEEAAKLQEAGGEEEKKVKEQKVVEQEQDGEDGKEGEEEGESTEISELVVPPKRPKKENYVWKGKHKHYLYRQRIPDQQAFMQANPTSFFAPPPPTTHHPYSFFPPPGSFASPPFLPPTGTPPFAMFPPGFYPPMNNDLLNLYQYQNFMPS